MRTLINGMMVVAIVLILGHMFNPRRTVRVDHGNRSMNALLSSCER